MNDRTGFIRNTKVFINKFNERVYLLKVAMAYFIIILLAEWHVLELICLFIS